MGGYELYIYILPLIASNMYMIISDTEALIIDPIENDEACELLKKKGIKTVKAILTHEHFDHISGVNMIRDLMAQEGGMFTVYANANCSEAIKDPASNLSRFFKAMFISRSEEEQTLAEDIFHTEYSCEADISFEGDTQFRWKDILLKIHSTPGHSPGSICIEMYNEAGQLMALATGDSLVDGNRVITRLPRGSKRDYRNITRPYLESFPPDTLILPGHGEIKRLKEFELG